MSLCICVCTSLSQWIRAPNDTKSVCYYYYDCVSFSLPNIDCFGIDHTEISICPQKQLTCTTDCHWFFSLSLFLFFHSDVHESIALFIISFIGFCIYLVRRIWNNRFHVTVFCSHVYLY